ncbi:unnamed protein product [Rotaria sordida]|uniref:Uncharacterized protein n=1 Tax=Rotaria sordida TaxID=392033 RepID=A0A819CKT3_9BILA|nr:unnamed protein product [Rotaria sordida]CAF0893315.1 unnamed protein product [Rotaria sordida]CAF0943250.1 unnamed protein product [Rotaria sordida]CAF3792907.1 unnamed protein product [Rotaria sordida]CAF3819620.1 unnamed protein product [Rotaria sordida]
MLICNGCISDFVPAAIPRTSNFDIMVEPIHEDPERYAVNFIVDSTPQQPRPWTTDWDAKLGDIMSKKQLN